MAGLPGPACSDSHGSTTRCFLEEVTAMIRPTTARHVSNWTCLSVLALLAACAALPAPARAAGDEQGFRPIFDGKTLDGWDGNPKFWSVQDGTITGQTTPENPTHGNTFLIWRKGRPGNFELRLEYRLIGGNSGIQIRSFEKPKEWGKWVVGGYQPDMDAANHYTGILYGERFRGILAGRGQKTVIGPDHKPKVVEQFGDSKELAKHIKKGGWNDYRVVAQGFHFTQYINGQKMSECLDEDKQMRRADGLLALQLHAGEPMKVQFRDIRIKTLPPEREKAAKGAKGPKGERAARGKKGAGARKIAFIAGHKSHGYGAHEHKAGCMLLARCLEALPGVTCKVYTGGWPKDPKALEDVDAIVLFADGGGGNPIIPHLGEVAPLMKKGVGLACLHYAVEVPKGKAGDALLAWIGGYYEPYWSVNPTWTAHFKKFPTHPVTRGVKPFVVQDEWYYHMRFPEGMKNVTPVLTAIPPDSTRERPDGAHSGNPTVRARKGMPEHVAWAIQRPDGGRGFGFTGGHFHWNWANNNFRTLVLNGITWIAKIDIPQGGIPSKTPTWEELEANQDFPQPKNFNKERWIKLIQEWNK
jgi:type 1 glutamine amidotransferase